MRTRIAAVVCGAVLAALVAAAPAQAGRPTPAQPPCESLEGCYGYEDMQAFYNQIILWIDEFSRASYMRLPPPNYVYVPNGAAVPTGCEVVADSQVYAYCGLDTTVYIGQDQLWSFYTSEGDAAAAIGIAHEWGHHVQWAAGILPSDQLGLIAKENQADCIAGAWVGYVDQQGRLEADDVDDINAILPIIAAAEGMNRDHGTLEERTASLQHGFDNGLSGCNGFFPGRPILA